LPIGTPAQDMWRLLREASRDDSAYDKLRKETKSAPRGESWKMQASANLSQDPHTCRIVVTWRQIVV
jgi:hypothetical protein